VQPSSYITNLRSYGWSHTICNGSQTNRLIQFVTTCFCMWCWWQRLTQMRLFLKQFTSISSELFLLSAQSHLTKPWPSEAELFSACRRDTWSCWLTSDWDSSLCRQKSNSLGYNRKRYQCREYLEYLVRKIPDLTAIVYMSLSLRSTITP